MREVERFNFHIQDGLSSTVSTDVPQVGLPVPLLDVTETRVPSL